MLGIYKTNNCCKRKGGSELLLNEETKWKWLKAEKENGGGKAQEPPGLVCLGQRIFV